MRAPRRRHVPTLQDQRRPALASAGPPVGQTEMGRQAARSLGIARRHDAKGAPGRRRRHGLRDVGTAGQHDRRLARTDATEGLAYRDGRQAQATVWLMLIRARPSWMEIWALAALFHTEYDGQRRRAFATFLQPDSR